MNDLDIIVEAYLHSDIPTLKFLLSTTPNINEFTNDGETLLTWGCSHCSVVFVNILLQNSLIDLNKKNLWGFSPLSIACSNNSIEIVQLLLNKGVNIDAVDKNGDTSILTAYKNNALDIIELLLDHNANIYINSHEFIASNDNLLYIMDSLSVSLYSSCGFNLMHKACNDNNVAVIDLLLSKYNNEYIHNCDEDMLYPLHYACMNTSFDAVCKLLQHGANPNVCSKKGFHPLEFACMAKSYPIAKLLIEHGADVNLPDQFCNTPLMYACIHGCTDLVNLLIEHNVDVNKSNSFGYTPLMHACMIGNLDLVKILLNSNASINETNGFGVNALYFALRNNDTDIAKFLIFHDSDISFLSRNSEFQLIKDLLKCNNAKIGTIVALHTFDAVNLKNNLYLYQKQYGSQATDIFIKQLKSSKDYKCCQKLNKLFKRDLNKLIESKNDIENRIKASNSIVRKMSYAKDKEVCLTQILQNQKKLHNIRSLLRTLDDFTCTNKDLSPEISLRKSMYIVSE